jgi:hypothetical protein
LIGHIVEDKVNARFAEVVRVEGEILHVVGLTSRRPWETAVSNVELVSAQRELRLRVSLANKRSREGTC